MVSTTERTLASSADAPPTGPAMISRIVVGVDGGAGGKDAVALAAAVADVTDAELVLAAVHPEPLVVLPEEINWTILERSAATMLDDTRKALAPQRGRSSRLASRSHGCSSE
jgi:nucleotide-binding universal stress UspA family protein